MADILITLYSLLLVWLLGLFFLRAVNCSDFGSHLTAVAVGFCIGSGLLYIILFIGSIVSGQLNPSLIYLALLILGAFNLYHLPERSRYRPPARREVIGIVLIVLLSLFILVPTVDIGLDGDGWVIWAFKAKAFFVDGKISSTFLTDMERYAYAHLDYPLLIPILEYWVYVHLGHVNDHVIRMIPLSFWILMLSFFYSSLSEHIKTHNAALSTALLAFIWPITENAVLGLADVVQATYNMIGLVFLFRWMETGKKTDLMISGLILGLGANVKNEGLSLWISAVSVLFLWSFHTIYKVRSYEKFYFSLKVTFIGVVICSPWIIQKRTLGIRSELFSRGIPYIEVITNRLGSLAVYYLKEMVNIGYSGWGLLWISAGLLFLKMFNQNKNEAYKIFSLICLMQFLIFVTIYAVTPHDFSYHLQTSGKRTLLQIVPAIFWLMTEIFFQKET